MKKRISAWLLVIAAVVMTLALSSCKGTEDKLLGTWEESEALLHGTITFEPDGIGNVKVLAIGVDAKFNWELDNKSNTIQLTYPDAPNDTVKFEILDLTDDTLIVSVNGQRDKFTRVKE